MPVHSNHRLRTCCGPRRSSPFSTWLGPRVGWRGWEPHEGTSRLRARAQASRRRWRGHRRCARLRVMSSGVGACSRHSNGSAASSRAAMCRSRTCSPMWMTDLPSSLAAWTVRAPATLTCSVATRWRASGSARRSNTFIYFLQTSHLATIVSISSLFTSSYSILRHTPSQSHIFEIFSNIH